MTATRSIVHGDTSLALHTLRGGSDGVLLLHELGGTSTDWQEVVERWPGAVHALDFAGHGRSDWRRGGGYTPELFAGDADAALAVLGPCHLVGAGLGAYVALLLAGGRPALVPAALLLPGAGLDGGGAVPDPARRPALPSVPEATSSGCDPLTRLCEHDLRPADYARAVARDARRLLLAEDAGARPPWWEAMRDAPGARPVPARLGDALAQLASQIGAP
jgi:pimeloyl-ACP methyl ester carboxylesterase